MNKVQDLNVKTGEKYFIRQKIVIRKFCEILRNKKDLKKEFIIQF